VRLRRIERQLDALRDSLLEPPRASELERQLGSQTDEGRRMRRSVALGDAIRTAWQDGPPAPPDEVLLARLRPALQQIDAELQAPSPLARALAALRDGPRLVPGLATAGAAAGMALALLSLQLFGLETPTVVARAVPAASSFPFEKDAAVYDLEQQAGPVFVFDAEAATILWVGDGEEDLSRSSSGGIV
jgi:anti-sigma factor RsiW